jgi:hypothetical protein
MTEQRADAAPAREEGAASARVRYRAALATLAPYLLLGVLPVLLWTAGLIQLANDNQLAVDFQQFFYPQARLLIEGNPQPTAYPPLTTLLYAPFALLPADIANAAVTAAMFALAAMTLAVLGIKDWRCYGAAALWPPMFGAIQTANVSLIFALGVALLWRWRARALPAAAVVGLMIVAKMFLWPLALWLAATRRWRAVAIMVAVGVLASAVAWIAVIDLDAISRFPTLVRETIEDNATKPYTLVAVLTELGAATAVAYGVGLAVGAVVLAFAVRVGRRGAEASALTLFLAAALLLSPIVWLHYLVILIVPVALARPRFSMLWLVPLPLILCPEVDGTLPQKALLFAIGTAIVVLCLRDFGRAWKPRPGAARAAA